MAEPIKTCLQCGAELSPETLEGSCPSCTARLTFGLPGDLSPRGERSAVVEFGEYELIEEIGRGGMGLVYKARQRALNRVVALKMILAGRFASASDVERFKAEAQAAATLRHPNIVGIHEVGQVEGQHYFSMDYVPGRSLAELVHDPNFTIYDFRRAAHWLKILAEAIHYAHQRGVLHRDLKPSNILIDDQDQPRITDFGLAKRLNDAPSLTLSGKAIGSPSFMPPEQAVGNRRAIGWHSDVYALGGLLYWLLTGRAPFAAETTETTLAQVLQNEPVSLRALNPSVPRDLETICLKCLEKEPARRYPTAQQLADEIGRFISGEPIFARRIRVPEKCWRWSRRRPAVAGLLAALGVSLLAGIGAVLWQWQRAEGHARAETHQRLRAEALVEQFELQQVDDLLRANDAGTALTRLGRVLRSNPKNRLAAEKTMAVLAQRCFAVPFFPALQHGGPVNGAALSRDGRWLVTASQDGSARVGDALSGEWVGVPMRHLGAVQSARFSSDGRKVVTASLDTTARIWDARTGEPLTMPLKHADSVNAAEFSPDDRWIVTACSNGMVRLWDPATGQPAREPWRQARSVAQAHFSPDGKFVVSIGLETVCLYNVASGQRRLLPHSRTVRTAQFSPDSQSLVTACWDGSARVWDVGRGKLRFPPLREAVAAEVWAACFSPDGRYVVTTLRDRTARLWDLDTREPLANPFRHTTGATAAQFSADGQRLVTIARDHAAYVWEVATGRLVVELIKHPGPITAATFTPDGERLLTASMDGKARMWDLRSTALGATVLRQQGPVRTAHFSPDGRRIVTASYDNTARVWNARTGQAIFPPMVHSSWTKAWFSPDGRRILTASLDRTLGMWDANTGQEVFPRLTNSGPVRHACFDRSGRLLAAACDNGMVHLWSAESGRPEGKPLRHASRVWQVNFSPDGRRLVSACGDSTARIWDLGTRRETGPPLGHGDVVNTARFSPDGSKVITASADHTARLWDVGTGQALGDPLRHLADVRDAVFSLDGQAIVTASADNSARVWDSTTGQPLMGPVRHESEVHWAELSGDRRRLLTAGFDGTARVWDCATGRPTCEPLRHGDGAWLATFSPDGQWILTASRDGTARLWEVPMMSEPSPGWLPELGEAIAGQRLNPAGIPEPVDDTVFWRLKAQLKSARTTDPYTRWAQWILANPTRRGVSPSAQTPEP